MLQVHFAHNGITDNEKKKNSLLVSLGSETLASLSLPDLPHEKAYKAVAD